VSVIRTSFEELVKRLGEPETMEPSHRSGSTVLVYRLQWRCGCRAEGARDHYTCRLCATHVHPT
jgi:hypothetical protein